MSDASIRVRGIRPDDETAWRRLWAGYCAFYEVSLPAEVTAHTWRRILDPAVPVYAIAAEDRGGRVVGIANYILHENTWTRTSVCYLEDLFVEPDVRGTGAGRALLDWLVAETRARGWSRLYWMTKEGNATARRLYDRYTRSDGFVRYVVLP